MSHFDRRTNSADEIQNAMRKPSLLSHWSARGKEIERLKSELARLREIITQAQSIEWGDPTYFSEVFNILRKAAGKESKE